MGDLSVLDVLGAIVWGWIVYRVALMYVVKPRKPAAPPPAGGALAAKDEAQRAESERARKRAQRVLGWVKAYALAPQRIVNAVVVGCDGLSMASAAKDVREAACFCFAEGRCRGVEFTRFVAGEESLAAGNLLVFLSVEESDLQAHWYALVAPRRYLDGMIAAKMAKLVS